MPSRLRYRPRRAGNRLTPEKEKRFSIRKFVGWQLFSYWQLELFGGLRRSWVKPCLLGLLNFPGAWALVNHVKVLFGATPNVLFISFQSDGLLPEVSVELRINKSLGTSDGLSRKVTIRNCVLLAIHQDVITSLVLGRSVPNVNASAAVFERHGASFSQPRPVLEPLGSRACAD